MQFVRPESKDLPLHNFIDGDINYDHSLWIAVLLHSNVLISFKT
jgi:hypothetical protein